MLPVNGFQRTVYDWLISVDWQEPIKETWEQRISAINIPLSRWDHIIKVTPNWALRPWRAKCLGAGGYELWNNNIDDLEFSLEYLPGYAFSEVWDHSSWKFMYYTWYKAGSLISMPKEFSLNITNASEYFMYGTRLECKNLKEIPWSFTLPQTIQTAWGYFLHSTRAGCVNLSKIWEWFNLPQQLWSVGNDFLVSTWTNTSLSSLPNSLSIPSNIKKIGVRFFNETRLGCRLLSSEEPASPLSFPDVYGAGYCYRTFLWCNVVPNSLNSWYPVPKWWSVMIRRNS